MGTLKTKLFIWTRLMCCIALLFSVANCKSSRSTKRTTVGPLSENVKMNPEVMILSQEIKEWMSEPKPDISNMPIHLKEFVINLNHTTDKKSTFDDTDRIFSGSQSFCGPCEVFASVVIFYSRIGGSIDILANFLVKICFLFIYKSTSVCKGLINQDKDRLNFIIRNTNLDGPALCSLALGGQGCGPFRGPSWTISIPPYLGYGGQHPQISYHLSPPSSTSSDLIEFPTSQARSIDHSSPQIQYSASPIIQQLPPKTVLKVLHLTDPHFDPEYVAGSNAVCEAPLCCNLDSGKVKNPSHRAGKWGDYRNCDSPKLLMENMLHHISTVHPDIDYIFCTGDLVPHHIWKIDRQSNINVVEDVTDMMLYYFPNTPIYGAIGNHESFPRDSYPPPEVPKVFSKFGNQWLYDAVVGSWERLQKQALPSTARFGGYYSILIRPGLRLISINTNFCYILNWWVLYKPMDPGNVLQWLVGELQGAESRNEYVHIIGHVPPLYVDCYDQWAHQFSRIVTRYANIIRGQFYGHSHLDEHRIHYDVRNPRIPVGVEYITPNNGPFTDLNPAYRIFYIDGDHPVSTRHILDYDTYVMNLTHANVHDDPRWYKLYSAKEDLELPDLLPHSWDKFTRKLSKDSALFHKYFRYQMQDSDPAIRKGCDGDCRKKTICSIVEGDAYLPRKCKPNKR